jgi:aminopeptidase N
MNNIPESNTYGFTVYQKGADLVHTLRNYMGDSLFFAGSHYYMNQFAYGNANSADLRDALTAGSGIDMTRFFDDWVFTPGFPHFSIDSVVYVPGGLDHYFVYTRQRSRGNSNHIYSMPVEITFANDFMDTTVTIQIDSATQMFHIPLVGIFNWVALDRDEKISDAIVDNEINIIALGTNVIPETNVSLNVLNLGTGINPVRVENNYVLPDGFKQSNPGIRLSDYHYWKVDGIFSNGFLSKATFSYDGSTNNATTGYLDNTLITGVEDSLVILYRQGTWDDWQLVNGSTLNIFAPNDKRGQIIIDTLKIGEYVLGYYDYTVSTTEIPTSKKYYFTVQPNPASSVFNFHFDISKWTPSEKKSGSAELKIFDTRGITVLDTVLQSKQTLFTWNAGNNSKGIYFAMLTVNGEKVALQKIILAE